MKCGSCGGFYNPRCQNWPACQPAAEEAPGPDHTILAIIAGQAIGGLVVAAALLLLAWVTS